MLVIKTIDDDRRNVRLEVSNMENGCVKFAIIGDAFIDAEAILDDGEKEELRKWLS
jgi:hypothetical protein